MKVFLIDSGGPPADFPVSSVFPSSDEFSFSCRPAVFSFPAFFELSRHSAICLAFDTIGLRMAKAFKHSKGVERFSSFSLLSCQDFSSAAAAVGPLALLNSEAPLAVVLTGLGRLFLHLGPSGLVSALSDFLCLYSDSPRPVDFFLVFSSFSLSLRQALEISQAAALVRIEKKQGNFIDIVKIESEEKQQELIEGSRSSLVLSRIRRERWLFSPAFTATRLEQKNYKKSEGKEELFFMQKEEKKTEKTIGGAALALQVAHNRASSQSSSSSSGSSEGDEADDDLDI